MSQELLFLGDDQATFVIDIPCSLEVGNGGGRILSLKPPDSPYLTPEPRGNKREIYVGALPREHNIYHQGLQNDIERALRTVYDHASLHGWCLARSLIPETLDMRSDNVAKPRYEEKDHVQIVLSMICNRFSSEDIISNEIVLNQNVCATHLCLSQTQDFLVPGNCAFIYSSIRVAIDIMQDVYNPSDLCFDFVIMDPPWSNRSVRHGSQYITIEDQLSDPFEDALRMVDHYCKVNGRVGIWITNKPVVRERVQMSMESRNFHLEEEWVWVKVTTKGEPVISLNGVWRQPYEVLLLFRHEGLIGMPSRRYIFAVPDIHSRKPNLKFLVDLIIRPSKVLELFARNLTSGWWSIGDEVLKFQHRAWWHEWPRVIC